MISKYSDLDTLADFISATIRGGMMWMNWSMKSMLYWGITYMPFLVIVTWTSTKCLFQSMLPCSVAFCQVIPMYWFNLFIAIQMMRYRVDIRKKKCWKVFSAVVMLCFDKCLFGCRQCCYNCFAMQPDWKARYCCKWRLIYPY